MKNSIPEELLEECSRHLQIPVIVIKEMSDGLIRKCAQMRLQYLGLTIELAKKSLAHNIGEEIRAKNYLPAHRFFMNLVMVGANPNHNIPTYVRNDGEVQFNL
jgi:hypothetical protein